MQNFAFQFNIKKYIYSNDGANAVHDNVDKRGKPEASLMSTLINLTLHFNSTIQSLN